MVVPGIARVEREQRVEEVKHSRGKFIARRRLKELSSSFGPIATRMVCAGRPNCGTVGAEAGLKIPRFKLYARPAGIVDETI